MLSSLASSALTPTVIDSRDSAATSAVPCLTLPTLINYSQCTPSPPSSDSSPCLFTTTISLSSPLFSSASCLPLNLPLLYLYIAPLLPSSPFLTLTSDTHYLTHKYSPLRSISFTMPFFRRPKAQVNSTAYGGSTSTVPHYKIQPNRAFASSSYAFSRASSESSEADTSYFSDLAYLQSATLSKTQKGGGRALFSSASSTKSKRSIKQRLARAFSSSRKSSAAYSSTGEEVPPVPKLSLEYVRAMASRSPSPLSPLSPVASTVYEEDSNRPTPRRCQTSMSAQVPSSQSNNSIFSYARAVHGPPSRPSMHPQLTIQHALPRHVSSPSPTEAPKGGGDKRSASSGGQRISHQRHGSMPAENELSRLSADNDFVFTPQRFGGIGSYSPRSQSPSNLSIQQMRIPSPSLGSIAGSRPCSPASTTSTTFRVRRKPVPSMPGSAKARDTDGEDTDVSSLYISASDNAKVNRPSFDEASIADQSGKFDDAAASPELERSFRRELDVLFEELLDACQRLAATAPSSPASRPTSHKASAPSTPKNLPSLSPATFGLGRGSPSPTSTSNRARSETCSTQSTDGPVTPIDKAKSAARRKSSDRAFFGNRVDIVTPRKTPKSVRPGTPLVRYQIKQIERIVGQASPEMSSRISTPLKSESE